MKSIEDKSYFPKISVIVPVYNTEKYLRQCLDSLQRQTLKDIEIIIIDDGSTDSSRQICDAYAEKDNRFKVIHKANEGLSAARNDGLDIASANYIMFVDSDDWVDEEFCNVPFQLARRTGSDIVIFQCIRYGKKKVQKATPFPKEGITPKEEVLTRLWYLTAPSVWNKLYDHKLFHGIRYPVGRLCEDNAVTPYIEYKAKKIFLVNKYLYHYRDYRPGSITNNKSIQMLNDHFFFAFKRIDDLKKWGYDYKEREAKIALSYLLAMGRKAELSPRCNQAIKDVNVLSSTSATWKQRVMFKMFKLSPLMFDFFSIVMRRRIR